METATATQKPKKTSIQGRHNGKRYRLFHQKLPNGGVSPCWYVYFEVAGKRISHSTGTSDTAGAHRVAKAKLQAALDRRWEPLQATKIRQDVPTIGKILDTYRAGIHSRSEIKDRTIGAYVSALRVIVQESFPGKDLEEQRASILTRKLIQDFKAARISKDDSIGERAKAITTINSTISQARAIFSAQAMELYEDQGLKLPDLRGFMTATRFEDDRDMSFRPIPKPHLEEMQAAAWQLLKPDSKRAVKMPNGTMDCRLVPARPDLFIAFILTRYLGLRMIEVEAARVEWIERWPEGWRFAVTRRSYFKPKRKEGRVPMASPIVRLIVRQLLKRGLDLRSSDCARELIIPSTSQAEREVILREDFTLFLRKWLPDREKAAHELRKQAGSEVYTQTGSIDLAAEFLRNEAATCKRYYATLLVQPPALTFALNPAA